MYLLLAAALMLIVPTALFVAGGRWMLRATGRARFRQRRARPESVPLNFRLHGYTAADAIAYWQWLGADGRAAEVRFLKADMVFPLWYGGLMLAGLFTGWVMVGRPFSPGFLIAPVASTVVADWLENAIHLQQLARLAAGTAVQSGAVQLASRATTAKLALFFISALFLVAMALWVAALAFQS